MNMLMKIINHILSMIRNISFSYAKRIIVTLKLDVRKRYCNIINIRVKCWYASFMFTINPPPKVCRKTFFSL